MIDEVDVLFFVCPVTGEVSDVMNCESFAQGLGCKYKNNCKDYKDAKTEGETL
jgi:hypothetical protein